MWVKRQQSTGVVKGIAASILNIDLRHLSGSIDGVNPFVLPGNEESVKDSVENQAILREWTLSRPIE